MLFRSPAYFGGYINDNLVQTFAALPALGPQQAWQLAMNSFEASFVSQDQKAHWGQQLDRVFRQAMME